MSKKNPGKVSLYNRCLNGIERAGNALPHPIILFAIFALAVVVISAICAAAGVSATGDLISGGELKETTVTAVSLLTKEGLAYIFTSAVNNFTTYAPLGMVLVAMLGVGVAEKSGMINALLKNVVRVTPAKLLTPMIVFLGVMSNIASDAGYVILIPLGAMMFRACGRHPLAGLAAAFAGVSGGFSANLLVGTLYFHSYKHNSVLQELYAKFIMYNFTALIALAVSIPDSPIKKLKRFVNFACAISLCRGLFRGAYSPDELLRLLRRDPCYVRPGRVVPRNHRLDNQPPVDFNWRAV